MTSQKKSYIFALLSVLCWSTVATAFKIALQGVHFLYLLMFSSFVSALALLIILLVQKKFNLLFQIRGKKLFQAVFNGFLNPFLYYVILFKAYSILPAQEAMTLNYTWPVMLVLLSIPFLKQKIGLKSIIALLISFAGIIIIGTRGRIATLEFTNPLGDFLAIGSSIIWALYWLLNVKDITDEAVKLFLGFLAGFVFSAILAISTTPFTIPESKHILAIIYIGLFEMSITFIFWLKALKLSSTTDKVSNLIFLSPFISLFFIHFVLGESILISSFAGLILIVGGILLQKLNFQKQNLKSN